MRDGLMCSVLGRRQSPREWYRALNHDKVICQDSWLIAGRSRFSYIKSVLPQRLLLAGQIERENNHPIANRENMQVTTIPGSTDIIASSGV